MTNPFDTNSPFIDNQAPIENKEPAVNAQEFDIRTMNDDLEKIKNNPIQKQPIKEEQKIEKPAIQPPVNSVTAPQPTAIITEKETISLDQKEQLLKQPEVTIKEVSLPSNDKSSTIKIVAVASAILLVAVIGLGGYYFWMTQTSQNQTSVVDNQNVQPPIEQPVDTTPVETLPPTTPTQKYSADKPNYLVLDLASKNSDDIKSALLDVKNEIANYSQPGPYEFIVVDANNNPVAFPIFATAAKFNLSPKILSNLDTDFSLFFFNDSSNVRLALASKIKNKEIIAEEILKEEKSFVSDADFMFLSDKPETKTGTFNNGSYNNFAVRYLNLNSQMNLSIDYTMDASYLYIGTSKNTLRAVLDKAKTQTTATTQN